MKKTFIFFLIITVLANSKSSAEELIWYVAASMLPPAKKVSELFNQQNKTHRVLLITGGSGQLFSKIQLSKKGDIYSPASRYYLEVSQINGLSKKHSVFLIQTPVFGISKKGAHKISSFSDLLTPGVKISVGNPQTMALGRLYLKIEEKMQAETIKGIRQNITVKALNVTQIANYLKRNIVDAGTIFDTVALAHKIPYIEIPEDFNITSESFWIELSTGDKGLTVALFKAFIYENIGLFTEYGFKLPPDFQVTK